MKTEIIRMTGRSDREKLEKAANYIREGELVAFPTETVYGLGANVFNSVAVRKIFAAKNRPPDNPLIVHISNREMLEELVSLIPKGAEELMKKFWPGPLTLIFPKSDAVPDAVTCGLPTVAVRMPSHPIALELIKKSRVPIAAPSANLSGKPSPTRIRDVIEDMDGRIACIIDGGDCEVGVESTVLDLNSNVPTILRPGGVSREELEKVLGRVMVYEGGAEKPASPGMKYRHYAPKAKVILVEGGKEKILKKVASLVEEQKKAGKKVGVLMLGEKKVAGGDVVMSLGRTGAQAGKNLFALLREMDRKGVDMIIVEGVEETGRGLAVMNRLRKAASQIILV